MRKIFNWFSAHKPTKRKLIQVYAALLFNANAKGFISGNIYKGPLKNICTPGLNCYSCPGASGACPLGSLQNSLSASGKTVPYYVFGIIMLYGLMFGRWICGFLCPFGLIQELLHKIPTPKLKKSRVTRVLSYFKYVILVFFVFIVPIAYAFRKFPLPGFCKYICPAGTLEGAMGLLSNPANENYLRMLGPLFTWKFLLMVSFIVTSVFIFRVFCRFFCPLGALYALFNKISLVGVKVESSKCTDCGLCIGKCKMDIKHVGDTECIQCGECLGVCPTNAIEWKGSRAFLKNADTLSDGTDSTAERKNKKHNTIIKATVVTVMVLVLGAALIYYNFIDGKEKLPDVPPVTDCDTETETNAPNDDSTPPPSDITVGTAVGSTCPNISIDIAESDAKFDVQQENAAGRVVILNFWYTTCGPCLEELPYFYQAAKDYGDKISVIAVHIEQPNVDVKGFIEKDSGHPEWNDGTMTVGWDTGNACIKLFNIQACPVTVVIGADGVITDNFVGGLKNDELIAAIEKALGE